MGKDGKFLENLVRQIEELNLPDAFTVKATPRVYNDDGVQIAEFDIEIRGRLGTTDIAWLIECRDRPSEGPAPGSWIEQLVGRRDRFNFHRVTAVSSTGFSPGAIDYAKDKDIELRDVRRLKAQDVDAWLATQHMSLALPCARLENVMFIVDKNEPKHNTDALIEATRGKDGNARLLRSTDTGETISAAKAFAVAVNSERPDLLDGFTPDVPERRIRMRAKYPDDRSHFVIDTARGAIRLKEILFSGVLSMQVSQVPLSSIREYARNATGEIIAQSAAFVFDEQKLSLEFHRIKESGETHVVLRKLEDK